MKKKNYRIEVTSANGDTTSHMDIGEQTLAQAKRMVRAVKESSPSSSVFLFTTVNGIVALVTE